MSIFDEFKKSAYEGQLDRAKSNLKDLKWDRFGWKIAKKFKSKRADEMLKLYDSMIDEKEKEIKGLYEKILKCVYGVKTTKNKD